MTALSQLAARNRVMIAQLLEDGFTPKEIDEWIRRGYVKRAGRQNTCPTCNSPWTSTNRKKVYCDYGCYLFRDDLLTEPKPAREGGFTLRGTWWPTIVLRVEKQTPGTIPTSVLARARELSVVHDVLAHVKGRAA